MFQWSCMLAVLVQDHVTSNPVVSDCSVQMTQLLIVLGDTTGGNPKDVGEIGAPPRLHVRGKIRSTNKTGNVRVM